MRWRYPHAFVLLVGLALGAGCHGKTVTEILVSVATDLQVPSELATVGMTVETAQGAKVVQHDWDLFGPEEQRPTLPMTIGLIATESSTRPIRITIVGYDSDQSSLVTREALLPFAKDTILLLRMNLLRSCVHKQCQPALDGTPRTCVEGGKCIPIDDVEPERPGQITDLGSNLETSLPFDAGQDRQRDLGISDGGPSDASQRPDAAQPDAARPDAARPDAARPDAARPDAARPDAARPDTSARDSGFPADVISADLLPNVCKPAGTCSGGWCKIPRGTFRMGAPLTELCRDADEDPHTVTLTRCFEMQQTEVTQQQFETIMGYKAPGFPSCGNACPIEKVTWHQAAAYCNQLSQDAGLTQCYQCGGTGTSVQCAVASSYVSSGKKIYDCPGYRLPTEAEWEWAARAGTTSALHNGHEITAASCDALSSDPNVEEIAWYDYNANATPHPVKGKQPNTWGLYDMPGNVAEWTADKYVASLGDAAQTDPWEPTTGLNDYVVARSGRWDYYVRLTRSANRTSRYMQYNAAAIVGLRCVRSLMGTAP